MNYIELFAKGGLTKSEKSEGEQRAIQLLESLQELTGVDPKQAAEILNQFKDDPETVNSIQEYVNLAIDPQSDENVRSNAISELTKIFNPNMESQIFKCGGKLQQLVTKFGKGGGVDCGCGGIKLDEGGQTPIIRKPRTWNTYPDGSTQSRQIAFQPDSVATMQIITDRSKVLPQDRNGLSVRDTVNIGGYLEPNGTFTPDADVQSTGAHPWFQPNKFIVPVKQEGGELTRRQARELAAQNKGFNGAQFSYAMANAKNALRSEGLRGRELRQAARQMVAGYRKQEDALPTHTISMPNNIDFAYEDELVGIRPQPAVIPVASEAPIVRSVFVQSPSSIDRRTLNPGITGNNPMPTPGTFYPKNGKPVVMPVIEVQSPSSVDRRTFKCGGKVKPLLENKPKSKEEVKLLKNKK